MQQWQDKYLAPEIGKEKLSLKRVKHTIRDFFTLLIHSLSPHEIPKEPPEKLPKIKSNNHNEIYDICKDMYSDSNDRIDGLEDKAIKLVSFITVLFALISFAFLNIASAGVKYILMASMVLLLLAILTSFRCVNIKSRQSMFLPSIYDFDSFEKPVENFNINNYSEKMLQAAVFNQNVADNTADILKSTRNLLFLSICLIVIAFLIGAFSYKSQTKTTVVKIENPVSVSSLEQEIKESNKTLDLISNELSNINDQNRSEFNELAQQLKASEEKYNELATKINEMEKRLDTSNTGD
ncbi:coiled-coil domain-containing protein [Peribacillus frigoritolerans]|uniref:coiled-coil domain-containing protein n=1 Tax=Peribacillus frigoritolerans TaxID=450367 RepID=UPI003F86AEB8